MTPLVKDIIMSSTRMPALFLGHGSPMNVLEDNLYTRSWQKLGMTLPRRKRLWWFRLTGLPVEQE
ncbi:putative aromatic ring-opening dioxygenase [Escherichia coli]|uniref:Putative aromatic ring-opening dioxygenase n=1 Tax=Escherichia coli TaxID=562 RepID=A0A2X1JFK4_ECOLX|nr:putative aromatic ring-opening dioxygenase [Escherichia coli]